MELIIDVGNTRATFALFDEDKLIRQDSVKEKDKYCAKYFSDFIGKFLCSDKIKSCYLSSVVPEITGYLEEALRVNYSDVNVVKISPQLNSNLNYNVDDPSTIGADIIADLAIGKKKYGFPLLICDLGTATKVLLIDNHGDFSSCVIIPGLTLSLRTLVGNAALLPKIDITKCDSILAKNTEDAMNAGVAYAHINGLVGICNEYEKEVGYKCTRIITGGCAFKIRDLIPKNFIFDENFLLEGINLLGKMNEVDK